MNQPLEYHPNPTPHHSSHYFLFLSPLVISAICIAAHLLLPQCIAQWQSPISAGIFKYTDTLRFWQVRLDRIATFAELTLSAALIFFLLLLTTKPCRNWLNTRIPLWPLFLITDCFALFFAFAAGTVHSMH